MDSRRARRIVVHSLLLPAATLAAAAGVAVALGYGVGMTVFFLSVAAAAGLAGLFLSQTRNMQPDSGIDEGPTGRTQRSAVGLRSELTDDPDLNRGRQVVVTRYVGGLFVQSALAVLYLGGLFGV